MTAKSEGQPPNAFKKYPRINDAYSYARKIILSKVDDFNRNHPEGLGFWAPDPPVMNYVRSCIPTNLDPPVLGKSTKDIQARMQKMIYPLIESKLLCDREFAEWIKDQQRIREFLDDWFKTKTPTKQRGKQPRYTLEDFVEAKLISHDSLLILRASGNEYHGTISANFGVEIDLGLGAGKFKSPNEVISKGLKADFGPWKCFWVKDASGKEILLDEIRQIYATSINPVE